MQSLQQQLNRLHKASTAPLYHRIHDRFSSLSGAPEIRPDPEDPVRPFLYVPVPDLPGRFVIHPRTFQHGHQRVAFIVEYGAAFENPTGRVAMGGLVRFETPATETTTDLYLMGIGRDLVEAAEVLEEAGRTNNFNRLQATSQ